MRVRAWTSLAVAAGTLTALVLPPSAAQAAPATLSIQVGANVMVDGVGVEGTRFLSPPTLTVHKGDTLSFQFNGFDTATLIPVGQSPDEWAAENIASPTGAYQFIIPDADDTATFEFNPADAFPSDPSCGAAGTPCSYDGKSVVNSGLPFASSSFDVSVANSLQNGDVFWVLSFVHVGMAMRVQVVDDSTPTTTQDAINSYAASQLAANRESAAALIPRLQQPTGHNTSSGKVWDAYAGFDGNGYALDGMFPTSLRIKKGDKVRWHFDQLTANAHTITFPKKQAVALNAKFGEPVCEATPTDTPPDAPPPAFCSTGPQNLEVHIPAAALVPAGNHHYAGTSSGLRSSGVEGAGTPSTATYTMKFTHKSHKKGFRYACIIHGAMMSGTVIVS